MVIDRCLRLIGCTVCQLCRRFLRDFGLDGLVGLLVGPDVTCWFVVMYWLGFYGSMGVD